MEEYKAVLSEASTLEKPYSEIGHLYKRIDLYLHLYGLKGVRNRGLREVSQHETTTYSFKIC
tara:strand:- start:254 stop:439 length:186 start_codon:yes stop_codon:yes gene_type:complete